MSETGVDIPSRLQTETPICDHVKKKVNHEDPLDEDI
jgi:hypothetical protein